MLVLIHFDCIPHRMVWLGTIVFLCLWQVHRTRLKQACIKIKDAAAHVVALRSLGEIMHNTNYPKDQDIDAWAKNEVERVANKLIVAKTFWRYVKLKWLAKTKMWVVGNQNLPYAKQDTNVAIKNYHANLKVTLRSLK
jgi:hypothetical protein